MYRVGIITVPERKEIVEHMLIQLKNYNIPYELFVDEEHKGQPFNFTRMLNRFCHSDYTEHIILCTDDILFKVNWYEHLKDIIEYTNYQVVALFTNMNSKPNDVFDIHRATSKFWMYDVAVCYRQGVLTPKFYEDFIEYTKQPERIQKELAHYDNMMSSFLIHKQIKCGTTRPNYVVLQKVKSIIGHTIKDREQSNNV